MRHLFPKTFLVTSIAVGALWAGTLHAQVADFVQVNLVSDLPGLATITDPELVNPWGVSHSSTSPFWTSNQGKSTATLYAVTDNTKVSKVPINGNGIVNIPTMASGPQGPTGQVSNTNTASFLVKNGGDGGSAHFIFANLNGTISAWDTGTTAFIQVTTSGAVYTGCDQRRANAPLCRRFRGRQGRRLRQLLRAAECRGQRIRQPRAARWARPVQRAGHRRQHLRDLCARRTPGPNQRPVGFRGRGDFR